MNDCIIIVKYWEGGVSIMMDIPSCEYCKLTEEKARCDIYRDEKSPCLLTLCKKCIEKHANKICEFEGCKKYVRLHRLRNLYRDKLKRELENKFNNELEIRQGWQSKYP